MHFIMELEKIIDFLEKEKDYVLSAILYTSIKIAECVPTSLYIQEHGVTKENNPLLRSMMNSMGINEGIVTNQLLFGTLLLMGTYFLNKEGFFGIKREGTKAMYAASVICSGFAITNWIEYFAR